MNGEVFGNFRLVRELGSGGMGTVYEAVDTMLERRVAIKLLRPEIASKQDLIERFRAEAVTLAKLNHPAIATLYAFLREGEQFAMVMEFVPGRTLEALLSTSKKLPPALAVNIVRQMLDGVGHAHGMNVLHRDIKSANIMITDARVVKVTDFGIARILGSSRMTREGKIIGTLEYVAPERIRGEEEDPRSDLYSAAAVLFELLAGRLPFVSDTDFGLIQAHLQQTPPELSTLGVSCPPQLQSVLRKGLAKAPPDRYQSAREFSDALASAVAEPAVLAPTRLVGAPPPSRRTKDFAVVGAALALLGAGIGVLALLRPASPPVAPPATVATAPLAPAPAKLPPPAPGPENPVFIPPGGPVLGQQSIPVPAPIRDSAPLSASEAAVNTEPAPPPKNPSPKNIRAVRRLYIEKMENGLDAHIKDEMGKQFPALRLVTRRADADAVMKGKVEKHDSAGSTVTRGYLGIKSEYSAAVSITDIDGANQLWSTEVGDARAVVGAIKRGGPKKVAERIVGNLKRAIEK